MKLLKNLPVIFLLIGEYSHSSVSLFRADDPVVEKPKMEVPPLLKPKSQVPVPKSINPPSRGNLPEFYSFQKSGSEGRRIEGGVIVRKDSSLMEVSPQGMRMGDVLDVEIIDSVIAWEGGWSGDAEAPVRGIFRDKSGMSAWVLLGDARLDGRTERVVVRWRALRRESADPREYEFEGVSLGGDGAVGLLAEIHSREALYFAGEVVAAGASGMTEAGIERRESPKTGELLEVKSESNLFKRAMISALGKTGERLSERMRSSPKFGFVQGPIRTKVLVTKSLKQKQ